MSTNKSKVSPKELDALDLRVSQIGTAVIEAGLFETKVLGVTTELSSSFNAAMGAAKVGCQVKNLHMKETKPEGFSHFDVVIYRIHGNGTKTPIYFGVRI